MTAQYLCALAVVIGAVCCAQPSYAAMQPTPKEEHPVSSGDAKASQSQSGKVEEEKDEDDAEDFDLDEELENDDDED